ncbi:MAG: HAMP domain-containing protein, partial [Steroidobacteraceae bacterium]|nr:HAMP domain-containing protein [Steroidobacteraceae bacterium]
MPRPSFRSTLVASFLLVAGTLAAAAASGWLGLEAIARAIQDDNHDALVLSAAARELGERTVSLERSARQFIVLGNPALAERFEATLEDALGVLARLTAADPALGAAANGWRTSAQRIRSRLENKARNSMPIPGAAAGAAGPEEPIDAEFQRLSRTVTTLADAVRAAQAARHQTVVHALENERARVSAQILGAIILAAALAAASGWWLLRPLARIEHAIARLGDNRLAEPIRIDGPADLRQLGERLDWLRLRLAELEANRNRVLRHVSHELKTPLASIREGVALLADDVPGQLNADQREVTRILDHGARTLQARIEQLLRYNASQFDARRLDLQ